MDKKFLTKVVAAVLVALGFYFLASASWQVAIFIGFSALVVDFVIDMLKGGKGWLLFVYAVFAFFAHFWSGLGWDWLAAFGGFFYFATDEFLVESKLADWFFSLVGIK